MGSLYSALDDKRYIEEDPPESPWRSEVRRDYARIIHCPSFRRLQGKTQLFPGYESDFFRNRLTHSLEVAQIAESIADNLNYSDPFLAENKIDPRLCFTAALLHDIGHPPFGHNGEEALDERMLPYGGFEGNAQSLRIVTQLEKKKRNPEVPDLLQGRAGLNLTYRTLAAILKYDTVIPSKRRKRGVRKGYYFEDREIVADIKRHVAPEWKERDRLFGKKKKFKTIECAIMDLADDIAYSTYDLEDSLKAGFLSPSKIVVPTDERMLENVAKQVSKAIKRPFSSADVIEVFSRMFSKWVSDSTYDQVIKTEPDPLTVISNSLALVDEMDAVSRQSDVRTAFTSDLVGKFVRAVSVDVDPDFPQLSTLNVDPDVQVEIEVLKRYTYEAVIASSRVRLSEYRGHEVVGEIFDALMEDKGFHLLPDDARCLYMVAGGDRQKEARVVCDFIAGMTDRYALEFHGRLHSDSPQTIFKEA